MRTLYFALSLAMAMPTLVSAAGAEHDHEHSDTTQKPAATKPRTSAPAARNRPAAAADHTMQHHHAHEHDPHHGHGHHGQPFNFGEPGKAAAVTRTYHYELTDGMRFVSQGPVQIRKGETIRFVVRNSGALPHEFSLGDVAFQAQHAAQMKKMPHMQHTDPNTVSVAPGQTAELIWTFSRVPPDSVVQIACHVPGHYEAGMKADLVIGR